MKDYNFFSVYDRKKGINIDSKSPYFIASILILLVVVISAGLVARNIFLNSQLQQVNKEIAAVQQTKAYKEAEALTKAIQTMKQYDQSATVVLADFEAHNVLGTAVLDRLSAMLPATVRATNLSIDHANLSASFAIPDKKVGAELLLHMEESGLFSFVHAPSIRQNEEQPGFIMDVECEMKAGEAE